MFLDKTLDNYRQGALGAVMDEYERAVLELAFILQNVSEENYSRIADAETENEDCRSIQTIVSHVVRSGYSYSNYIRKEISMPADPVEIKQIAYGAITDEIDKMLAYTFELFDERWRMMTEDAVEEEITRVPINTRWGPVYNIDQLLEHAIVHVLRHRRQVYKFLLKFEIAGQATHSV